MYIFLSWQYCPDWYLYLRTSKSWGTRSNCVVHAEEVDERECRYTVQSCSEWRKSLCLGRDGYIQGKYEIFLVKNRIGTFNSDPGSEFFPSRIPDPNIFPPGSASNNLSILTQKMFLSSRKYDLGWSFQIRIPNSDPEFLPIPDPGVKKAPVPGSGSATLLVWSVLGPEKSKFNGSPGSSNCLKEYEQGETGSSKI